MQARQNLGAPVTIQADAAHQELLVHRLDLRARALLPLRHGVHDVSCHSQQPVQGERVSAWEVSTPSPCLSPPLKSPAENELHCLPARGRTGSDADGAGSSRWAELPLSMLLQLRAQTRG